MKILVIDIETTGFLKSGGKICEIGVVELCLCCGAKKIIFDMVINPNLPKEILENTWIVKNKYMTVDEIDNGVDFSEIKEELQELINNYPHGATAFNRNFDFDFLESYGITFPQKLPCPMILSTDICKMPLTEKQKMYNLGGKYKWPKVEEAYNHFFPRNNYTEIHRGADDAFHEADIVFALHKKNLQYTNL